MDNELAQIAWPPLGSDCPKDIGKVGQPKSVGRAQVLDIRFDLYAAGFAFDLGFSLNFRVQVSAFQIYFGRAFVAIVHRLCTARNHAHVISGSLITGHCGALVRECR